jgi:hypothetical protein
MPAGMPPFSLMPAVPGPTGGGGGGGVLGGAAFPPPPQPGASSATASANNASRPRNPQKTGMKALLIRDNCRDIRDIKIVISILLRCARRAC